MSELKTRFIDDAYVEYCNTGKHELAQIYLKSDADKVIAEKDAEIAQLQAMLEERNKQIAELKKERDWLAKDRAQAYDDLEKRAQLNIKQEESIRHHKYKRCLEMAVICFNRAERANCWKEEVKSRKRSEKWLELAEKFKPNNSTAQ